MNLHFPIWLKPCVFLSLTTTTKRNRMDDVAWRSAGTSCRITRQTLQSLVVYGSGNDPLDPPEPHILPTPTDVPVPEPTDVPVPEPMDVPPPTPRDVPPPKPRSVA